MMEKASLQKYAWAAYRTKNIPKGNILKNYFTGLTN